ncbi:MAG TPA: hydroxymethylbilane synthase [Xanthobacteraceae bacterium]|nr:hydroxymethylbilane synthase [Xanthobacteraceae bacterium]
MAQSSRPLVRVGTRGSPLALAQAGEVKARLLTACGLEADAIAIHVIRTSGDRIQDRPLAEAGGKGLFTKEIEQALADGEIDLAVHSAKDLPTFLPPGLTIAGYLPREDVRDVLVARAATSLDALPRGAVVGTASLRRQALVRRRRPDVTVVTFRGNVETRLRKLEEGQAGATILALAGLKRLGREGVASAVLPLDAFPPAVGQGAIALEARADDRRIRDLAAAVADAETGFALAAERAFLAALDGSCRTPIAGHARIVEGRLRFHGLIVRVDGSELHETTRAGGLSEAAALGADAGRELRRRAAPDFFGPE